MFIVCIFFFFDRMFFSSLSHSNCAQKLRFRSFFFLIFRCSNKMHHATEKAKHNLQFAFMDGNGIHRNICVCALCSVHDCVWWRCSSLKLLSHLNVLYLPVFGYVSEIERNTQSHLHHLHCNLHASELKLYQRTKLAELLNVFWGSVHTTHNAFIVFHLPFSLSFIHGSLFVG